MANWLKEELREAEQVIDRSIEKASSEINRNIRDIGEQIANQRQLTLGNAKELIDYAALTLGQVLDDRIEKAKKEAAALISEKLKDVRNEMSEAATFQKRSAIRNTSIAIFSSIVVGLISLLYKRWAGAPIDLYVAFRAILLAAVVGHLIWLVSKLISNYVNASKLKQDAFYFAAQFLGFFSIRGLGGHIVLLLLTLAGWAFLTFFVA